MSENKKHDVETTGHSWDGIEEYNNPLPRWWVWVFYATIVWGIGYSIAYPAWPGIKDSTAGLLGWSTRANVAAAIEEHAEKQGPMNEALVSAELSEVRDNPDLYGYASSKGAAVFRTWCAQCHGANGGGAEGGYPVLADNDWLWGGEIDEVYATIAHGIRNEDDPDARWSQMPAFGDGLLAPEEIDAVVNYVMSLSGTPKDPSVVEAGAELFDYECSACHGADGTGDIYQGAPNLTDAIWLYGGDYESIHETVTNSRFGVMPSWQGRLDEASIRAAAIYVRYKLAGEQ